jgi:hypothetical protein
MIDWKEYTAYYIKRLGEPDRDDGYHGLIEASDEIIPFLVNAFRVEQVPGIRADLVEIIWQHRNPETIEFLSEALNDPAQEVWKNALDGLVALACPKAIEALRLARSPVLHKKSQKEKFQRWLEEAIEQTQENMRQEEGQESDRTT